MNILLTGAAGFIGSFTAKKLLHLGYHVTGIDNLNDYYDVRLKNHRLDLLEEHTNFTFHQIDIENYGALEVLFDCYKIDAVINLAARAGVRYSIENPFIYFNTNANGTVNLLELCKKHSITKFVLASTSSLYAGQDMPFVESLPVNTPISPYAASKKAAEMACYTYHYLYGIDVSVVRYFTVYGPAGRPDMSIFRFIKQIDQGEPIIIYGDGSQSRDFTFVEDIAEGTVAALKKVGFEVINLGNNNPNKLMEAIHIIEENLGKKANVIYKPFHKADMLATWANIEKANQLLGWSPKVSLPQGIKFTIDWYRQNYDFASRINLTE
jgi:nucleoside-diphosphate-sugar epimerase